METIIGAAIGAVAAIVTCLINNNLQRAKEQFAIESKIAEINSNYDKQTALIKAQIDELAKDVSKHNNLIDRMYAAEDKLNVIETKIKSYHGGAIS